MSQMPCENIPLLPTVRLKPAPFTTSTTQRPIFPALLPGLQNSFSLKFTLASLPRLHTQIRDHLLTVYCVPT